MISVIMLTFNRENYIEKMIKDILNQTYTDFEYIIVDNGSSDNSGMIADRYAQKDKRIKVIHLNKPFSIGYGRNTGLDIAKGEYITFVDDDDRVKNNYLEVLVDMLEDNEADISVCGIEEQRGKEIVPQCVFHDKYIFSGEEAVIELMKREKIRAGLPTKLIKKTLFEDIRFEENCRSEDARTSYKIFAEAKKVVVYGIPLYCAVKHENNNSAFTNDFSQLTYQILHEYMDTYNLRLQYLLKKFPDNEQFWHYIVWSFMISMCEKVTTFQIDECKPLYSEMWNELYKNQEKIFTNPYLDYSEQKTLLHILEKEM